LCTGYSSPSSFYVIILYFSKDQSNWSSPSFSSTTFQIFQDFSDLLSEVSNFQHRTKLCSKCSSLLVSSLTWSQIFWWKESSSWMMSVFMTTLD
jgi:hypothetical protein